MRPNSPIVVCAAVIRRGDRFLLCRRLPGGHHGGCWEFPGGKVDPGESEPEALRRELREELAVDARVGDPIGRVALEDPPGRPLVLSFWEARIGAQEPRALVHSEVKWVLAGECEHLDLPGADRAILPRL